MKRETMPVSVVVAWPHRQEVVRLRCPVGSTIEAAISASGLLEKYPGLNLGQQAVGIHGVQRDRDTVLGPHDRVEIYRPLEVSPTQARRLRAQSSR